MKKFKRTPNPAFKLSEPLDETLLEDLGVTAKTPRDDIIHLIKEHLNRRNKKCAICNKKYESKALIINYRRPTSKGGGDNIKNLQLLCWDCTTLKGNNTMLEVRKKLKLQKSKHLKEK
ncbi:MAG: HNH endonuclease signature motif containing protein [Candidatus Altiarchaeota archaeon]|nr:HNH endonuclease signature motif containing protein [Candidatus Altiarchaeota archaeon]